MANNIDMDWMVLDSPELAKLIGSKDGVLVSRPEVMEKLGAYLKKKNLLTHNVLRFTPIKTLQALFEAKANQEVSKMWGHLVRNWKLLEPSHATPHFLRE